MMKQGFWLIVLAVFFTGCSPKVQAQTYSSAVKKAIKKYEAAEQSYRLRDADAALGFLDDAIKADPNFVEVYIMRAYIYTDKGDLEKAAEAYENVFRINPQFYPPSFYTYAKVQQARGKYDDAIKAYRSFLGARGVSPEMGALADKGIANCEFSKQAIANPVPFEPINMGPNINTERPEYFPSITTDNQNFLFTRLLEDDRAYDKIQEDFFVSVKAGDEWQLAENLGQPINAPTSNEGAPSLAADGQTLIFTACQNIDGTYGPGRNGVGSCDLFYTYKVGSRWAKPQNLGTPVNSFHWETQPSYSADGKTLYFIRGLKSAENPTLTGDIYKAELTPEGRWTKPEKLSARINTPGHEASVLIHPDGKTLFFSSDGHIGMGGLDIYMSRKGPDGSWGEPINLGYPINTHADENSLLVSADGELAYFASDREGGFGDLDLYYFQLPKKFRPDPVTYLKGIVYDKDTKKPLEARFELIDLTTGEIMVQSYSNRGNGDFLVTLPADREYALNVGRTGYMFYSDNFEFTGGSITEPFLKDIPLIPIKVSENGGDVVLENVFFETAKFDLKQKSIIELDKMVEFLERNPTVSIELSGHTDDRGDAKANMTLSKNRANAVRDYLIEKGIAANRLTAAGYGETKPLEDNSTEAGRARNRRTTYKITKV